MILFKAFIISLVLLLVGAQSVSAQGSSWSQCQDGSAIARCETYDCPQGDTNKDGRCTLADSGGRLTDARNDSFCANPISGCGQVHYYPGGATNACLTRVEENSQETCDLYAVATPNFTPQPTATASPRTTSTPQPTATVSGTTTKGGIEGGDKELPKTGPEHIFVGAFVLLLGAAGVYLFEKYKTV